jgi:hypothetical protein
MGLMVRNGVVVDGSAPAVRIGVIIKNGKLLH